MKSALYLTNILSWIFIVLGHWSNSSRVDMSLHSDILFWFRGNPYELLLLKAAWLAVKCKNQCHSLWFDPIGGIAVNSAPRIRFYWLDTVIYSLATLYLSALFLLYSDHQNKSVLHVRCLETYRARKTHGWHLMLLFMHIKLSIVIFLLKWLSDFVTYCLIYCHIIFWTR